MKTEIHGGMLVVHLPLVNPPTLSRSGKTRIVATSQGLQRTALKIEGKPVHVVANAFIHEEQSTRSRWQNVLTWSPAGDKRGKDKPRKRVADPARRASGKFRRE